MTYFLIFFFNFCLNFLQLFLALIWTHFQAFSKHSNAKNGKQCSRHIVCIHTRNNCCGIAKQNWKENKCIISKIRMNIIIFPISLQANLFFPLKVNTNSALSQAHQKISSIITLDWLWHIISTHSIYMAVCWMTSSSNHFSHLFQICLLHQIKAKWDFLQDKFSRRTHSQLSEFMPFFFGWVQIPGSHHSSLSLLHSTNFILS